jgi:hypothetical protein
MTRLPTRNGFGMRPSETKASKNVAPTPIYRAASVRLRPSGGYSSRSHDARGVLGRSFDNVGGVWLARNLNSRPAHEVGDMIGARIRSAAKAVQPPAQRERALIGVAAPADDGLIGGAKRMASRTGPDVVARGMARRVRHRLSAVGAAGTDGGRQHRPARHGGHGTQRLAIVKHTRY